MKYNVILTDLEPPRLFVTSRAPVFLRAVVQDGVWGVLDGIDDEPTRGEEVIAYEAIGEPRLRHIVKYVEARRFGQWRRVAAYKRCDKQPDESVLRDTEKWSTWASQEYERWKRENDANNENT